MAISFREYPWYLQALIFFALALVIFGFGEYAPFSPVAGMRNTLDANHTKDSNLNREVAELQVYERRNAEFKVEMAALEKQLETLKTIVPEEKEVDEFMRLLQEAASASGVQIRSLGALAVVPKDYHYELPFEINVDGPYFSIEDFFARLSRLSRIINVGDLTFSGLADPSKAKFPVRPGTTVQGKCTVTTFFSKPMDESPALAGKKQPAGKTPPARK
jgi:type IV pilus assembly protein PilO